MKSPNGFIIALVSFSCFLSQYAMFQQSPYTIDVHGIDGDLAYKIDDSFAYAKRTTDWVLHESESAREVRLKNHGVFDHWSDKDLAAAHFYPLIVEKVYLPLALCAAYKKIIYDHGWKQHVKETFKLWPASVRCDHTQKSGFLCSAFGENGMLYHRCYQQKPPECIKTAAIAAIAASRALWIKHQNSIVEKTYKVGTNLMDKDGKIAKSYTYKVTEQRTIEINPHIINITIDNDETKTGIQLHTGYVDPTIIKSIINN